MAQTAADQSANDELQRSTTIGSAPASRVDDELACRLSRAGRLPRDLGEALGRASCVILCVEELAGMLRRGTKTAR